jgi:outer membrane protein OmpA-like peptidoglycan-associated protein
VSRGKLLAISIVWLGIVGAAAVAWRVFVKPTLDERQQRERELIVEETSGNSRYQHNVTLSLDQFSGYAVLRSPDFQHKLQEKGIRVRLVDDEADYSLRLRRLQSGESQMAVFTIDALIKASAELQDMPAVIIGILDETRGADAMVASKKRFPNVSSLNQASTRFVLTADSPSETLARAVMTSFSLTNLPENPFKFVRGPAQVLAAYRDSPPNSSDVYVVWEPFVSEILANATMHVVVDSSRFRGYIVDVLVVSRDYLLKHGEIVRDVVGSYFAAAYQHRENMQALVLADAGRTGTPLTAGQAERLVQGIRWRNTVENFAHFGIVSDSDLQLIEDMISQITNMLLQTHGIARDPTGGDPTRLYNERILSQLRESNFNPGLTPETIASDKIELPVLTPEDWAKLREVGELKVPSLVFARGTAVLTESAQATLDELVRTLKTWPQYYVLVRGNASRQGDLEANRKLAENRAHAAADYLVQNGIHESRISARGADPSGETSVSFVLGEAPY